LSTENSRLFFSALKFLTIFPVPDKNVEGPEQIGRSIAFFPVVGLIIGIVLGGVSYLLRFILPYQIVSALLVAGLVILTGANHLDGLMDTCDGMAAGRTRDERLTIMEDPHVGAFGIAGACLTLILKYAVFTFTTAMAMLLIFPVISRWTVTAAILNFHSAKNSGTGYAVKRQARWSGFLVSSLTTLILSILLCGFLKGIALMVSTGVLIMLTALYFKNLYGGLTGDNYGALIELGEIFSLLLYIVFTFHKYLLPGDPLIVFP
jgi:adenosylcobinamide-GDP ribazoletransferase